jgi:hypothetical protein
MVYQDLPIEQGQQRFEEIKQEKIQKKYIPIIVSKPKIKIHAETK